MLDARSQALNFVPEDGRGLPPARFPLVDHRFAGRANPFGQTLLRQAEFAPEVEESYRPVGGNGCTGRTPRPRRESRIGLSIVPRQEIPTCGYRGFRNRDPKHDAIPVDHLEPTRASRISKGAHMNAEVTSQIRQRAESMRVLERGNGPCLVELGARHGPPPGIPGAIRFHGHA